MGVHVFEVRQHDLAVEAVAVLHERVLHDRVGDPILVVSGDLEAAARAGLGEGHGLIQPHSGIVA